MRRALPGLLVVLLVLAGCGAALGDGGAPPTPTPIAIAAGVLATGTAATPDDPNATATRAGTASPVASAARVTATLPVTPSVPARTMPVRPGPPATPGTPGGSTPGRGTPAIGTPGRGTPGVLPGGATPVAGTTLVQLFAPYRPGGLAGGLRVVGDLRGYCWAGSEALRGRPDAWRCTADNRVLDPCIVSGSPDPAPLACAASPWAAEVALLTLTAPLPRDAANAADPGAAPWAIELADGLRCLAGGGAGGLVAGLRPTATCADGSRLLGDPDRGAPRWRIFLMRDDSPLIESREIGAVWR